MLQKWRFTDGTTAELYSNHSFTVWVFLAPECPLCISYSKTLMELYHQFSSANIRFVGVFSGSFHTQQEVDGYLQQYKISFPCVWDRNSKLAAQFKAKITPEVCVATLEGKTLYRGRIDNWAYDLGKKRTVITRHDLKDVLQKCQNNIPFKPYITQAVGCIIE